MSFQTSPPACVDNMFIFWNGGYGQCQAHTKTEGRSAPVGKISIVLLRLVCSVKNKMNKQHKFEVCHEYIFCTL